MLMQVEHSLRIYFFIMIIIISFEDQFVQNRYSYSQGLFETGLQD